MHASEGRGDHIYDPPMRGSNRWVWLKPSVACSLWKKHQRDPLCFYYIEVHYHRYMVAERG